MDRVQHEFKRNGLARPDSHLSLHYFAGPIRAVPIAMSSYQTSKPTGGVPQTLAPNPNSWYPPTRFFALPLPFGQSNFTVSTRSPGTGTVTFSPSTQNVICEGSSLNSHSIRNH